MDYVIIVNDNGELKTISANEIVHEARGTEVAEQLDVLINVILDRRATEEEVVSAAGALEPPRGYDIANETIDAKTRS